jgi:UDP:flavonoid glycosyltransferase YjiC (YdhE family)
MMHAGAAFHAMIGVVERLGRRCIVLTKHRHQLPATLPASALHCPFAPFHELFPLCAAVVHHGGIGTTARALASGTPQLILPFGFDQMDNAARVERLGAGLSVRFKPGRETAVEAGLKRLLDEGKTDGCRRASRLCADDPDALDASVALVEEFSSANGALQDRRMSP